VLLTFTYVEQQYSILKEERRVVVLLLFTKEELVVSVGGSWQWPLHPRRFDFFLAQRGVALEHKMVAQYHLT
jgi:hypothetical protein